MIGARVGNWYLEAEIGRGGRGVVYRARGYDDGRTAAVKLLTDPACRDAAFLARFPADMLALQRLSHPNIARFYDSGTHAGTAYYAAEFVDGTDLARLLEGGRRAWKEGLAVAVQAARALKHAHQRGVLHRDLKPAHFVISANGTLKLLDCGVAKVLPPPPTTPPPARLGSEAYTPPEAAAGKPLTRRSDVYSLGGVLYTLLTGRPPFTAATAVELLHKQCYALPERPALVAPDLPAELDELVCDLLAKNPARRPASAAAVLEELDKVRGKLERKGDKVPWPPETPPDPDAAADETAAPAETGGGDDDGPEPRPLMRRPAVVVPLFVLAVVGLMTPLLWPGPSADELMDAARPLLASADPADWDRAWDAYLTRLADRYPDRYEDEVRAAKDRIRDHREVRRAVADGAKADYRSDAERFTARGLRLAQAGDADAARRVWRDVVRAFGGIESERRWVDLAAAGLAALDAAPPKPPPPADPAALRAAVDAAKRQPDPAAALAALEDLYRDDPAALAAIREAGR